MRLKIPAITDFRAKALSWAGGLNGRVRNGNGCDPAGMVAGKAPGGRSGHAGVPVSMGGQITQSGPFGSW